MELQPKVYIITGEKNEGKTTLLGNVVRLLQESELETRGFLSEMIMESPDNPEYYLTNINTGNQQLLCSKKDYPGWIPAGRFFFNPVIIDMGNEILLDKNPPLPDFFIIDEVGKLESEGLVWEPAIQELLRSMNIKIIWTTRNYCLTDVVKHFGLVNYRIFETGEMEAPDIIQSILTK